MQPEIILDTKELNILKLVLEDVEKFLTCDFAVGGSMAQRALLPQFGRSIEAQKSSDIDLVLLGGSQKDCPVLPTLKNYFYVISITESFDGYYFGLIHKKTKKWVDLFPTAYKRNYIDIKIGEKIYKAESIGSQILYLAHDILWRIKDRNDVRQKWIDKIKFLVSNITEQEAFESEFLHHKEYLLEYFPKHLKIPENVREFIELILNYATSFITPPVKKNWFLLLKNYYKDSVTTSNGITIDSRMTMLRTLF